MEIDGAILIRVAGPAELADVIALERESFAEPWAPILVQEVLNDKRSLVLIAACAGAACGHAIASTIGDEGELARIGVAQLYRGCGLGGRLLDMTLQECRKRGVARMFLEVRFGNEAARRLYEGDGFRQVGQRRQYYGDGEDAIVMAKVLSPE